ncbi:MULTISPECIES: long-chain-fatty-acid--CoA ligase [unclassified Bacillus (in: firmicutes)]|uniref:long-chain-fatty-acid--CoA ligase n=1 Tax=unclassified Bacillus (in: firmicutes) TaxID=185979 RepID=UPI000BF1B5DF|nr:MULTISPECIES: long-chain-fatty-acid--CoA ligase [unclassified Bacillus (in: firmicutes)]PEJ57634.1 long-chain fatty acid--CoA ligase [Bacillus sp. AFS002410]PEL08403.1 long-chain fatty acid--CoA ligase [Bacillus sp. AFS017336]
MSWNLNENLRKSTEKFPNRLSLTFANESMTYRELDSTVDLVASNLIHYGIKKGDKVALLLGNCTEFVIAYYGILRAGGVVVPINPIYTGDEISYILSNSQSKAVIANTSLEFVLANLKEQLNDLEMTFYIESTWELLVQAADRYDYPLINEDDLAMILYTSGTTGKPKGAMLSQRNMASTAASFTKLIEFKETDRILAVLPMFHVFCMTVCINAPIMCGANIVISQKFSPTDVIQTILNEKITLFAGVPTMYSYLMQVKDFSADHFSSVRVCLSGGASIPVELLLRFEGKFNTTVLEGFGCSETSAITAINPLKGNKKTGSVGVDIPYVVNMIVDPNGVEVPRGEVGELIVKGPNIMIGYFGMPDATASSLKNGWFYTGDLAKRDKEGYIYIVDRKKDMVLVGGYNVYPREVEEVLYQHPAIVEAAIIGIPDHHYGESVKAFVVCSNESVTTDELFYFCKIKLAKYKVPKEIEIISEMPKNSTGKILRRGLLAPEEIPAEMN